MDVESRGLFNVVWQAGMLMIVEHWEDDDDDDGRLL